ncbi:MAG: tetratricopeptide repeat protein [Pyrinomonadaceae bacterium]
MRTESVNRVSARRSALAVLFALALCAPAFALAQDNFDYAAQRARAIQLYQANNFVEALPVFEKLYAANQSDVLVLESLSFILTGSLRSIQDPAARAKTRERARSIAQRARDLGDDSNLLKSTLDVLNAPDTAAIPFSNRREADAAMNEAEAAFSRGDLDKAIEAYQRALKFDPHLYAAALFTGDSYFKKRDYAKADEWFAHAAEIDPNVETAHRYWGDSLMAQGKRDEARDKFIEAIVAAPGDRSAYVGLTQWADKYGVKLAHPEIEVPTSVASEGSKTTINISPDMLSGGKTDDGSLSWIAYGATRSVWAKEKFGKEFPQENSYRHTLREEAEALHAVADMAREQAKGGKAKNLSPSLANLIKLDDAGLLEPFIFYTRVDRGIAQDYSSYRQAHRDKLQRYWAEFVVRK